MEQQNKVKKRKTTLALSQQHQVLSARSSAARTRRRARRGEGGDGAVIPTPLLAGERVSILYTIVRHGAAASAAWRKMSYLLSRVYMTAVLTEFARTYLVLVSGFAVCGVITF